MADHLQNAKERATDLYMDLSMLLNQIPRVPGNSVYRLERLVNDAIRSARVCVHSLNAIDEIMIHDASPSEEKTKPMVKRTS